MLYKRLEEIEVDDVGLKTILRSTQLSSALHCTKTEAKTWFKKNGYVEPIRKPLTLPGGAIISEYGEECDDEEELDDPAEPDSLPGDRSLPPVDPDVSGPLPSGVMH